MKYVLRTRDTFAIVLALVSGLFLASYDKRTDDTGIEVGLLLIASLGLSLLAPKRWWAVALMVGGFIPLQEVNTAVSYVSGARIPPPGLAALAVAFVGAFIGFAIARMSRMSAPA
jgi:hypothetical protein